MSITITERDLRILAALHDHRVMTTPQLGALFFSGGGVRAVQRRLKTLADHQQIERFTPRAARWTMPYHWILGRHGTRTWPPTGASTRAASPIPGICAPHR